MCLRLHFCEIREATVPTLQGRREAHRGTVEGVGCCHLCRSYQPAVSFGNVSGFLYLETAQKCRTVSSVRSYLPPVYAARRWAYSGRSVDPCECTVVSAFQQDVETLQVNRAPGTGGARGWGAGCLWPRGFPQTVESVPRCSLLVGLAGRPAARSHQFVRGFRSTLLSRFCLRCVFQKSDAEALRIPW